MSSERAPVKFAILAANAAFYRAFNQADFEAMRELWARRVELLCFHPGAPLLVGREEVMDSWRSILRQRPAFTLRCDEPTVSVLGEVAIVACYEGTDDHAAHLAATNVFVSEDGSWRMVHHHAGPLPNAQRPSVRRSEMN
jgi:ketosteroid isomerase-like protein